MPNQTRLLIIVAATFFSNYAFAAESSRKAQPSKNYSIGKPTQSVKPREIKETMRPDGSRSIVTGQKRDASGKIVGPHSHAVTKDGKVEYSRTAGGTVVKDSKKK